MKASEFLRVPEFPQTCKVSGVLEKLTLFSWAPKASGAASDEDHAEPGIRLPGPRPKTAVLLTRSGVVNQAFMKDPDDAARPEGLPERPQSPHPEVTSRPRDSSGCGARLRTWRPACRSSTTPSADPHERALLQRDLRWVEGRLQRALLVYPASPGRWTGSASG